MIGTNNPMVGSALQMLAGVVFLFVDLGPDP